MPDQYIRGLKHTVPVKGSSYDELDVIRFLTRSKIPLVGWGDRGGSASRTEGPGSRTGKSGGFSSFFFCSLVYIFLMFNDISERDELNIKKIYIREDKKKSRLLLLKYRFIFVYY